VRRGSDLFFYRSAMTGGLDPVEGWVVEFIEELDDRSGRTRAVNVRPI
jgi:hypothetical protein